MNIEELKQFLSAQYTDMQTKKANVTELQHKLSGAIEMLDIIAKFVTDKEVSDASANQKDSNN